MVVLAASICTASGKVLVSRQFVEVPRTRIEGLLAAFPKLIGSGSQHTVIETENIRYVYQPLGNLFLILLANRHSNILQDIETLRLLGQVVSKVCHSTEEEKINKHGFELISAFDEIVSLGYRDSVTLGQIGTTIEMESHEERIQEIIAKNKEKEAKEKMKEKIKMMDEQRKREATSARNNTKSFAGSSFRTPQAEIATEIPKSYLPSKPKAIGGGMKLGSKSKASQLISAVQSDVGYDPSEQLENLSISVDREPIHFILEEKINVQATRDGGLSGFDLRGELSLRVGDESFTHIKSHITVPNIEGLQFMANPKMDRALFNSENVLAFKDSTKGFPVDQTVGVLKWKLALKDSSALPFTINCWLSPSDGGFCDVDIEFTLDSKHLQIDDLNVSIPIPSSVFPEIGDCNGNSTFQEDVLVWELPPLNKDQPEAALHFRCESEDQGESFFPLDIKFSASDLFTSIQVSNVLSTDSEEVFTHSQEAHLFAEEYIIS